MKLKIIIYLITLFILIDSKLSAQNKWMEQILLLEEKIFRADSEEEKFDFIVAKAILYRDSLRYEMAMETLNRINPLKLDTTRKCLYYYQKSVAGMMKKDFSAALVNAYDYETFCPLNKDKEYLIRILLLENELWSAFEERIQSDTSYKGRVTEEIPEVKKAKYLRLSHYFPGLGLISSGHTGKGLVNLGLCTGFLGFSVFNIYTGFYVTSFFSGIDPVVKFYKGGKSLTERMLEADHYKKASRQKQAGFKYLSRTY